MTIQKPWFPSFFNWQPVPNKPDVRHKGNSATGIYGTIASSKDKESPICATRGKFAQIVIAQPLVIVPRLVYRTISLLTGDFIQPGIENGLRAHQVKQQRSPGTSSLQKEILKGIAVEFIKNTAKIALYAAVAIPLWAIAFYGLLCNPYDADVFFGTIENWTARDFIPLSQNPRWRKLQLQIGDYVAFCKQTNGILDRKNIYRVWPDYNPGTLRSQMRFISVELQNKKAFFSNEQIAVDAVCSSLRVYKEKLQTLSISMGDGAEVKRDGTLKRDAFPNDYPKQRQVAVLLKNLKDTLREIELNRELAVEAAVAADKGCEAELGIERSRAQIAAILEALNQLLQVN